MSDAKNQNNGGVKAEGQEPTVKSERSPVWVFVVSGVLLYLGMGFLAERAGGFHKDVYEPYPSAKYVKSAQPSMGDDPIGRGAKVYEAKGCVGCHQASGMGLAGVNPPLAGSDWVLAEGPNRLIRVVMHGLNGPITVKGQAYNSQMPPLGDAMTTRELADVLSYIRNSWGNKASIVKEAQVKAIADKEKGKPQWKPASLLELPDK